LKGGERVARKATTKDTIRKNTISDMKSLGVYSTSYNSIIDIYSELREQYELLTKEYKKGGYKYEIETADGGGKKSPIVATLETLRKDILAYSDRLKLNPKAMESTKPSGNKKSKLGDMLKKIDRQ